MLEKQKRIALISVDADPAIEIGHGVGLELGLYARLMSFTTVETNGAIAA